ncbi:MAG: hypothetical protein IT307_09485 [Chloroflexi bacterium]|nr:hypothetical protein [Chloroflexota bacterium]
MTKQTVHSDRLAAPSGPFSLAARSGNVVFVGTMAGQDAGGALASGADFASSVAAQGRAMFANWRAALEALGASSRDVVGGRFYATDWAALPPLGDPYKETFPAPYTARTTVRAGILPSGAIVSGAAIAVVGGANQVLGNPALYSLPVPLAQAGVKAGNWFFSTGLYGVDQGLQAPRTIGAQTDRTLDNLTLALEAAQMSVDDVVKANIFLSDPRNLEGMLATYSTRFRPPYPALTIAVQTLARPDILVEIELIAARGEKVALLAWNAHDGDRPDWTFRRVEGLPPADQPEAAAVLCDGWLYTGAYMGVDADGRVAGDVAAQTNAALHQLDQVTRAAGLAMADVVSTGVVLSDQRYLPAFQQAYGAGLDSPYPALSLSEGLTVHQDLLVQIEAIAHQGAAQEAVFLA